MRLNGEGWIRRKEGRRMKEEREKEKMRGIKEEKRWRRQQEPRDRTSSGKCLLRPQRCACNKPGLDSNSQRRGDVHPTLRPPLAGPHMSRMHSPGYPHPHPPAAPSMGPLPWKDGKKVAAAEKLIVLPRTYPQLRGLSLADPVIIAQEVDYYSSPDPATATLQLSPAPKILLHCLLWIIDHIYHAFAMLTPTK
ncbi:hypothetical protein BC939DRAFT_253252 [Gamsiella multidivaricata]|uniref:uncharacterized protein n=1 Tax=Gamsiella multidivaricata TaxID=101098 RepID=UPI0022208454|nr:uncharacterized protein BC939DRAFT_253252 [Gamsiella multidivaricata]KAI7819613.1 hypothetical protein BC939DRAFT_253252 [Gamsiella multidivaricata]